MPTRPRTSAPPAARWPPPGGSARPTGSSRSRRLPAARDAFYEYWWDAVREVRMDDVSRTYLSNLTNLRFFKRRYRRIFARNNRLLTIGFLPQEFRDELREPWTARDERRFERLLRV